MGRKGDGAIMAMVKKIPPLPPSPIYVLEMDAEEFDALFTFLPPFTIKMQEEYDINNKGSNNRHPLARLRNAIIGARTK